MVQAEDPITVLNNDYIPALPLTSLGKSLYMSPSPSVDRILVEVGVAGEEVRSLVEPSAGSHVNLGRNLSVDAERFGLHHVVRIESAIVSDCL